MLVNYVELCDAKKKFQKFNLCTDNILLIVDVDNLVSFLKVYITKMHNITCGPLVLYLGDSNVLRETLL